MLCYCRHLRLAPRCLVTVSKVRPSSTESQKIIVQNNSQTGLLLEISQECNVLLHVMYVSILLLKNM